jgi:hypothetical protein
VNSNPLRNAEFTLYSDKACSKSVRTYRTDGDGRLRIVSSDEALMPYLPEEDGTDHASFLYLRETTAPYGYDFYETTVPVRIYKKTNPEVLEEDYFVTRIYYYVDIAVKPETDHFTFQDYTLITDQRIETSVSVTKIWDDDDDLLGLRPERLTMKLLADGKDSGKIAVLSKNNNWHMTISNLPKYGSHAEIVYTWEEPQLPEGYLCTGKVTEDGETTFTNTCLAVKTDVSVEKVWDDDDDQDGRRPKTLRLVLSNGMETVLSEENNW